MNRYLAGRNRREFANCGDQEKRQCGHIGLSPTEVWPRNASRPSRGTLLAQQGRRGLVDTERRDRDVGGSGAGCPSRVRRRARSSGQNQDLAALGEIRQRGGKRVIAFCRETDFDTALLSSNTVKMEWPPKSGKLLAFPEVDRAEWCDLETARSKILSGQVDLIGRLKRRRTDTIKAFCASSGLHHLR
jgi:hypothetical protein